MKDFMKQEESFFTDYFLEINASLFSEDSLFLKNTVDLLIKTKKSKNKVIFVGNGGSASIAGHLTVDCINAANLRAVNFNDPGIITCFSNDYGYENWVSKALDCYAEPRDLLVLISSSGQSKNMLIGASKAKSLGVNIVTLTGFSNENPLKKMGNINLWVDSQKYNIVEMAHHIWLLAVVDYIIKDNKEMES
jgi:D-sedoheptulose 7-phosphate isomerase